MEESSVSVGSLTLDPARIEELRSYLDKVLSSRTFAGTPRRSELLRYVVERTLAGEAHTITEYGIGLDVFRKPSSFDPATESTVRSEMSRLRRMLVEYYATAGANDLWQIRFPKRGYIPEIAAVGPVSAAETARATDEPPVALRARWKMLAGIGVAVVLLAAVSAVAVRWYLGRWSQSIDAVVVLPFQNMTGDASNAYLADGVTEELTDQLAHVQSLRVVARTSAFQFKDRGQDIREIGRRLGADAVVEGSLRKIDGLYRLTVQLNRARDGYHILSQSFDGSLQEIVRLEAQAGQTLLGSLRPGTSLAKRRAPNPDAYELYLKARAYRGDGTVTAFEQAVAYLNQAIERDPDYADAYAALAGVYTSGAANFASHPLEYVDKAKAAAAKALELDSSSARALAAEGFIDGMRLLDWKKGEQELRESARLMPGSATTHNWLGLTLLMQGRFDEALAELRTAEKAEPLVAAPGVTVGLALYFARRYDDAVRQLTKVQTLFPDKIMVHNFTGLAWEGKGAYLKALAEYQLVSAQYPADVAGNLAHLYAEMGNSAQARALLARMEHPQPDQAPPAAFDIAVTYGALGDRDQAFEWLERAYDERKIEMLKVHPALDPLRDDPRYAALLRKAGLSQ